MNKQALEARAAALQTELDNLRAEIAKPALPEGFIAFTPTEKNEPPCHPKSTVDFIRKDGEKLTNWTAENACWSKSHGWNEIVAYKVTEEYVEPRPMKYSELPVGQAFTWGTYSGTVYLKIGNNKVVIIKGEGLGVTTYFTEEGGLKFYEVGLKMKFGELLTVK